MFLLQIVVISLMVLYLFVETSARLGQIGLVILLWLGFFTYCEIQFRRFGAKQESQRHAVAGIHVS